MSNPSIAVAKYEENTRTRGAAKYNAAKGSMPTRWGEGLRRFGITPGPITTQAYQSGISRAEYRPGDGSKWLRNWQEAMSR